MIYDLFELSHAAVAPMRVVAQTTQAALENVYNPLGYTPGGKALAGMCAFFELTTRRYGKPDFGLHTVDIDGHAVPVVEEVVWQEPFCRLVRFRRDFGAIALPDRAQDPRVLIVAPLSGHYATLLRGTVAAMLPEHDVYITDWADARTVPVAAGRFGLEDYIDYLMRMIRHLGPGTHTMGVCQPGVPLLAAVALMNQDGDPAAPASMVIMGSPIDTRRSPTVPNRLATERPISWFANNVITTVPMGHPGSGRRVYPGFLQLTGFMTMNLDRHMDAHYKLFRNLVKGDGDGVQAHREFYDEYLSVLDLTAEFYLETVEQVFQEFRLARGCLTWRGRTVDPGAITRTALMTVEGENDDISGIGQTQAAHDLCTALPATMKVDYVQPGVGHYGVFNGRRWRTEIQPRVRDFIRAHDGAALDAPPTRIRPAA
ncbi:polyhydroxyalkanoate depolymerase [Zavarzinia sp. CC-PAN008]|uniref:polyhydroxyalkanoate depolymerase n=1 Tax=Zavarzinia sp. CC-PAN008 TaxID=3243332 RepID=UPI003F74829E